MLMRHFGHGVGHLKYERHEEIGPKRVPEGLNNHGSDDSDNEQEDSDSLEPSPEGDPLPVGNEDSDNEESEGEDIEVGDTSGSELESDDGGYASL
jgi:hypothetical protein